MTLLRGVQRPQASASWSPLVSWQTRAGLMPVQAAVEAQLGRHSAVMGDVITHVSLPWQPLPLALGMHPSRTHI